MLLYVVLRLSGGLDSGLRDLLRFGGFSDTKAISNGFISLLKIRFIAWYF